MLGAAARFVECESHSQRSKVYRPPDTAWDVPLGWSDQFFDKAQALISASAAHPTLSKVQAVILIHNHSGNMDSKSSACWLMGGLAIRLAQGLGLNRNCEEWDISESEKQTRKRLWWALYVTDRFHSASLGRPISIRDEDNDVGYPDATASWREVLDLPKELDGKEITRFPSATYQPASIEGRVEFYQLFVQLVKLSEILGRILQGLYTPKAQKVSHDHGSDAIVSMLDHELTEWRFAYPKALESAHFDDFNEKDGYLAPVSASILLCYFSLLILLHRPFIERISPGKTKARPSYSSFRIGTSAATRGMRIASQMKVRDFLMFPYSFGLYPVLQCCLIHMYNTKNPDIRISSPAMSDLAKGLALVERLQEMSSTARRLHGLLSIVMSNKDIEVGKPAAVDHSDDRKNSIQRQTEVEPGSLSLSSSLSSSSAVAASPSPQLPTSSPSALSSSRPATMRVSDVGRGILRQTQHQHQQHQHQQHQRQRQPSNSSWISSVHNMNPPPKSLSHPLPPQSMPYTNNNNSSNSNYMYSQPGLSETMISPFDTHSATSTPSPTSTGEAFTLKQFGFNIPGEQNMADLDSYQQNMSIFSGIDFLPSFSMYPPFGNEPRSLEINNVTGQNNVSLSSSTTAATTVQSTLNQHSSSSPTALSSESLPSSSSSSSLIISRPTTDQLDITTTSHNTSNTTTTTTTTTNNNNSDTGSGTGSGNNNSNNSMVSGIHGNQDLSNNVFRNNPNNPFWGIPSSMDWTEWNEWNQRTQGSATWQPLN
ncbi:fungal-specific transcription factor [Phycomyces blakesleeanus NRRL 1555(-)]|uniref:Fungal-specific transcription factor n=1 Tax=Phycomyces blakesleeanus (strain ATCC 8743b / DSM 1359 / FGSC 10004 / NBRC 33097 / NRRL 1555) TaxID=763407 RepID=A0A163CXU7_PHYB8|nr:fungal-specific transcription factor [Phycomyces blakesleeanus NRRL 1555(-)]OAD66390.1 fungal-specific transcription factor [Phycomyces blakesleeanus NRRL 1555(-)]|eukprot:XP_018284430.1 fungal-specific transcription factor [Phycomyces blakesleeanus NRRL 1555(-)]